MKGQLAFSSTLSCTSRLNSRLSVVEILNCLSCVSRILNIVSTVKCLSTPCRRLSLIFSIFMLVSMMKATFQRRCLHHTSFLENAGGWYIPRTQGGILLCRLFVHYVEILVGSVKKGEQICRQLLDYPLYNI